VGRNGQPKTPFLLVETQKNTNTVQKQYVYQVSRLPSTVCIFLNSNKKVKVLLFIRLFEFDTSRQAYS
jgi:hypothetical protein